MFRLRGLPGRAGSFASARFLPCSATKTETQPSGSGQNVQARAKRRGPSAPSSVLVAACLGPGRRRSAKVPARISLKLIGRTVTQDQGAWVVDYRLRYAGETGIIVTPEEIGVKVEGWVSNSRVASHAVPRWSSLALARGSELSAVSEVIASVDESQRCRERLLVSVWAEDQASAEPEPKLASATATGDGSCAPAMVRPSLHAR